VTYNGRGRAYQYYPLLDWSDEDVSEFVNERGIKCHPLYYDEDGVFHVERRLGCMCCPLQSQKGRLRDFERNPRMVRFYLRYGAEYLRLHPQVKTSEYFQNVYEWFVCDVFCKDMEDFRVRFKSGADLFGHGGVNCRLFLEDYFKIDLSDLP
jgi:3'-phosphoadenosine 5'-phosphosulfate sulfotransferase (PAPS reductase)/FAD synthetase